MSFDAGAITGNLELETSRFDASVHHAEGEAEHGAEHMRAVFSEINNALGEATGLTGLSEGINKIVAGFSEGPLIGSIGVIGMGLGMMRELVEGTGKKIHEMGLAAEKAGVSTEWMSKLAGRAEVAHVGLEQLVGGFKILEQRAELAAQGNNAATKAFERLGISAKEAAKLSEEPEELFTRVQAAIAAISNPSEKSAAALGVLGRQGFNLKPVLMQSTEEIARMGASMDALGSTITDSDAESAKSMAQLEFEIHQAMFGIEKSLAMPVLNFLKDHMEDVGKTIESWAKKMPGWFQVAADGVFVFYEKLVELKELVSTIPGMDLLQGKFDDWSDQLGDAISAKGGNRAMQGPNGGVMYFNVNTVTVAHNAADNGKDFADKVAVQVHAAVKSQQQQFEGGIKAGQIQADIGDF